jgi:pimeloyl-ACP methyl ester carboxylesterase
MPWPDPPVTRYARTTDDAHIAYQTVGDGPFDLVAIPGYVSHVDLCWEDPRTAEFFMGLASFCRLILFDRRGLGLSDPVQGAPTLEDRMQDLRAVMDAADSGRVFWVGDSRREFRAWLHRTSTGDQNGHRPGGRVGHHLR